MIGKNILHYNIIEKLGAGGMGVVYKAQDTKLDRVVAIKFLPPHIAANDNERQRFKIEAKAAASLNHSSIAHIYAIEETDNEMFIVMEYIDGKELKDIIKIPPLGKGGTAKSPFEEGARMAGDVLPIDDILNYATQIAEGLKTAHNKGIVHRDIKSANIMLTNEGQIKIMDFGLAKVRGGIQVTKVGTTLGTAAYMSPEQTRGEEVDYRSDIWSLGVVLFEMLTGKFPFAGEYEQAVTYSILNENPDLSAIPNELQPILQKALAKDPANRYQEIEQLLADLKILKGETSSQSTSSRIATPVEQRKSPSKRNLIFAAAGAILILVIAFYFLFFNRSVIEKTSSQRKMLVVLPFQNLGPAEQNYFADGITGEITSRLSGISGLGVIARSSAMQYKNTTKSLHEIGEELSVEYVLEGTIQWEERPDGSKRVRVNPELIKIDDETQVWSQPYEENFSSVFKLQSDIAATVAEALNLKLIKSEQKSLRSNITNNSEAYDTYLRAKYYSQDITSEKNSRIAEELLEKAIKLDGSFAAAYAVLSTVQSNMYWSYFEHTEENLEKSKANAKKALLINPDLAEAHSAMGDYYYHGILDYDSALEEYNRAILLNPNHVEAYNGIAFVRRRQGKMRETIEYLEKTYELDPKDYTTVFSIGETYTLLREYEKSIPYCDKASLLAPEAIPPYNLKAHTYLLAKGNRKEARSVILNARERKIGLDSYLFSATLYYCDILDRKFDAALNEIKGVTEIDGQFYYKSEDLFLAEVYGFMNNRTLVEKHYKAAIKSLNEKIKAHPGDSRLYTSLGIAYAGLGEKENALREGKKGYELLPMTREAWRGSYRLLDLAKIYAMTGEPDLAVEALDKLLASPTDVISVALLKIDPTWDPLRENPKFQHLIQKYSGEGV